MLINIIQIVYNYLVIVSEYRIVYIITLLRRRTVHHHSKSTGGAGALLYGHR